MAAVARGARTNLALLVLLAAAFLTGWLAFAFATAPSRWSLIVHATSGFAIVALLPWKSMIARRGMRRGQPARWASILLGVLVVVSLVAGLLQSTGVALTIGPLSAMDFHVGAAIAAVPFVVWHVVARRISLRPADLSRRAALRGGAVLAGAAAAYTLSEVAVRAAALPGATRRFTGSYEAGSHDPDGLPISSWMFDSVPNIDTSSWALRTPGRSWTYDELYAFDDRLSATLDCTGGFYSTQEWAGVRLDRLLGDAAGMSIRVVSHTGYDRRFTLANAAGLLLATRIGGRTLDPGHGFPVRLVAPDQRGFWWVKWVVAVEVDDLPAWWQSPFPLQ
ncbi:MAG TPA: molybdopterin-dependent oxidoreductase [Candidatus Dormibacteraeota bacterium]|nr:molybdopterin-dependent oxidoreductase [Candidatus Dormibacteraeota bacterium]